MANDRKGILMTFSIYTDYGIVVQPGVYRTVTGRTNLPSITNNTNHNRKGTLMTMTSPTRRVHHLLLLVDMVDRQTNPQGRHKSSGHTASHLLNRSAPASNPCNSSPVAMPGGRRWPLPLMPSLVRSVMALVAFMGTPPTTPPSKVARPKEDISWRSTSWG